MAGIARPVLSPEYSFFNHKSAASEDCLKEVKLYAMTRIITNLIECREWNLFVSFDHICGDSLEYQSEVFENEARRDGPVVAVEAHLINFFRFRNTEQLVQEYREILFFLHEFSHELEPAFEWKLSKILGFAFKRLDP